MAESATGVLEALSDEERDALVGSLKQWQEEGVAEPRIPLDYDVDGDGVLDAWALSEDGELILVPVGSIEDTVFETTAPEEVG